jgi:membrane fusion protein (multidrug efflux system)
MAKRMILMLAVAGALIAALGFIKIRQFKAATAQAAAFQPPPEAVTTIVARQVKWPITLNAIGTVTAVQGVTVSADLPGIVARIAFDSGKLVREGDVLVELDTKQEQAQLAASEAQQELARLNFERFKDLVQGGAISRAEFDQASAERKRTEAGVGEIRATIERKTIRAPFSGVLGLRRVNLGQYLSAGNPVVDLQSLDPIYVNFGLPQQQAGQLTVGRQVRVTTTDSAAPVEFVGTITALDATVDPETRNIQVQATLANPKRLLRAGMFVQTEVRIGGSHSVVELPASAISYAPYGDSVFVLADLKDKAGKSYRGVRQEFVKLQGSRGDQVAVVSGVEPGDEVVTSGTFKLRNGAAVVVNNKVKPANHPSPKPEDS